MLSFLLSVSQIIVFCINYLEMNYGLVTKVIVITFHLYKKILVAVNICKKSY